MVISVQKMQVTALILYMLLTFNYASAAQEKTSKSINIHLIIHKKIIQYGKSLKIKLKVPLKNRINISALLEPLKGNFDYSITDQSNKKPYIIYKIKLFPLHKGIILIPTFSYKQYKSKPVNITVTAAHTQNNQHVSISINKTHYNPWVREQVRIVITIITTEKNIILTNKNINQQGIESYLIPQTTKEVVTHGEMFYQHKIGWDVFFLYTQKTMLTLPVVEYSKNGVPEYKFHFQKIRFNVKKLPIYINPTIPVGKITLNSHYLELPKTLLQPNMTAIIQYTLTGNGIPAKWLPSLVQRYSLSKNKNINFSAINTRLKTNIQNNTLVGKKISDFAFTPLSNGLLPIHDIQLQYFNPATGLLNSITYKHPKLLVLHWFIQIILLLTLLSIIYITTLRVSKSFIHSFRSYKYHSKCRFNIRNAKTYNDFGKALEYFSLAEEWPTNITINQWLHRLSRQYNIPESLFNLCNRLNQNLYSPEYPPEKNELEKTREGLLNILNHLEKKPKKYSLFKLLRH